MHIYMHYYTRRGIYVYVCFFFYEVDPSDCKFELIARPRNYAIGVMPSKANCVSNLELVYKHVYSQIQQAQPRKLVPKDALLATKREALKDGMHLMGTRPWLSLDNQQQFRKTGDWSYILSPNEHHYVKVLNELWMKRRPRSFEDAAYNLSDNPDARISWTLNSGAFPTFRTNTKLMYMPVYKRCLTRKECLALMGFPVYQNLADEMGMPLLQVEAEESQFMLGILGPLIKRQIHTNYIHR